MLKKILRRLCLPIRLVMREELQSFRTEIQKELDLREKYACQNIELQRHHKALESTVDYVERRMLEVASFPSKFELLTSALTRIKKDGGLFCEFGVFSGGTINHIAGSTPGLVYGFDSFEGLPEGWYGLEKGHFTVDNLPKVLPNVRLVKGWFNETLPKFVAEHPETITFLHVDCDLYSSTKLVFDALAHKITAGTVIVFDEYFNYPNWENGEFKAFQEFINGSSFGYDYIGYNRYGQQVAMIIREKN
jgi:macrocin-O-methyltransferase TylF-like protien